MLEPSSALLAGPSGGPPGRQGEALSVEGPGQWH